MSVLKYKSKKKSNCYSFNEITNDERMYLSNKTRYIPSSIVISFDEYTIDECTH